MSHREVLELELDVWKREVRIREFALDYLTDDEKQQRYEGFIRRAESTQHAIKRHTDKRDKAQLLIDALTAAIAKFPEGES